MSFNDGDSYLSHDIADADPAVAALLRAELERQGIVVGGREVARVVGAAIGKEIEWAG